MTKVTCLGAGGFIGGHLVQRLLADGHEVRAVDIKPLNEWYQLDNRATNLSYDMADMNNVRFCLNGQDVVYCLAADMGGMGFLGNNRVACMRSTRITMNCFDAAIEFGLKVFYSSSACVYPDFMQQDGDIALKESDAWPADPEPGYGLEKIYGEEYAKYCRLEYGVDSRVARFHNIFGPRGTYDGGREKAPAAMCRKVAEAILSGSDEIEIWGDGEARRSYLYVDECLEGVQRLMDSDFIDPINVGSDEAVTVNEMVDILEAIAGAKPRRIYVDGPQGVRTRNSDNTLCRDVLDWAPSAKLYDGLEKTYAWVYDQMAS